MITYFIQFKQLSLFRHYSKHVLPPGWSRLLNDGYPGPDLTTFGKATPFTRVSRRSTSMKLSPCSTCLSSKKISTISAIILSQKYVLFLFYLYCWWVIWILSSSKNINEHSVISMCLLTLTIFKLNIWDLDCPTNLNLCYIKNS